MFKLRWPAGLVLVAALTACSEGGLTQTATHFNASRVKVHIISRDLSQAIGERGYAELIQSMSAEKRLVTQADVKRRVESITRRLVRQAVAAYPFSQDWAWELQVLEDEEINAHCMPGGKMTLNTGLIALAEWNEHKLATVLGHEIAHALLEHGRVSISRGVVAMGTMQAVAQSFKMGQMRTNKLFEAMDTVTLPLDRQQEREADLLGMQLMARAGFDPVQGASFWVDMGANEPMPRLAQRLVAYRGSHPSSAERLANLTEIARQLAAKPAR